MSGVKIRVLGCGTSGGVPMVGVGWGDCDPGEPRNRRRRSSILIEVDGRNILVDTSPDCREQLLDADITRIDAILYTHAHADHCHGIDDLRWVCHAMGREIPVYGDAETLERISSRFDYAFEPLDPKAERFFYKPVLLPNVFDGPFTAAGVEVIPFKQDHGYSISWGFRIGSFAYSTDVLELDETAFEALEGVETWIVDALQITPHPTHAHLEKTLGWIERLKPARAILTHMNTQMDYRSLLGILPDNVMPAFDGMELEI